jgi:hypothetical protein
LEITPNSSSSNFSLKNTIKDKETNTSSNSKIQPYIQKTQTLKMDENKQFMHNSMGFRKTEKKGSAKFNNSLMRSNKKIDNKNITSSSNTKLLYEKIKKKLIRIILKKVMKQIT